MTTRRALRIVATAFAALVALIAIAAVVFIATFNADAYKPRIVAAVKAATGRDIAVNGRIGLTFSLHPTIEARDVTLANPAGFSRPDTATIRAIDLQIALLPLIHRRIAIDRLILVKPDILLERTAQGAVNWTFTAPLRPVTARPAPPVQTPAGGRRAFIALREVRITNGRLAYRDDRTGHVAAIDVQNLSVHAASPQAPIHLSMQAMVNRLPFTVMADTGSFAALQARGKPWPLNVEISAAGATARAQGTVAQPLAGRGYTFSVSAAMPDLAALRPFAPNAKLPPLRDVAVSARVTASGGPIPTISDLVLHAGVSDLSSLIAGLKIGKLDVSAPALDQPLRIELAAERTGLPVTLGGTIGPLVALLQSPASLPVDLTASAAGGTIQATGTVSEPALGLNLAINAQVPDLASLSPLVGHRLPPLQKVVFQGRFSDPEGLAKGASLQAFKLTSAQGDVAGAITATPGRPASLTAQLTSRRIDADALQAAFRTPTQPPAAAKPPPPPARRAPVRSLFPVTPIPFGLLRLANADLQLSVATLVSGGQQWHDVTGHLVLQNGDLRLDPFKATLPAGALQMSTSVDANKPLPPLAFRLQAPSVSLKSLLLALGEPAYASGAVAIAADLHGAGNSPHAIAASLEGTLSLSMHGGEIDTRLLEKALGPIIRRANPLGALAPAGTSQIRCVDVRLTAHNGVARLNPFVFSSSLITMDGSGNLDLGRETLDLQLHPQGRIGGAAISIPLTVTGSFFEPRVVMSEQGVAERGFEAVIGAIGGKNNPLSSLSGSSAACTSAPTQAGAHPAPTAATPKPKLPNAGALLRQLLR